MIKERKRVKYFSVLGVSMLILLALCLARAGAEENRAGVDHPRVVEKKSLTRGEDFIIIPGEKLRNNLNRKITSLSLFASTGGEIKPVPFQVDEMDPEGDWVLTQIPPGQSDSGIEPDRDDDNGHLDENDQLVFMVRDAGERIGREFYPQGAVKVDEIELRDPVDGGKAWVYLCSFRDSPPRSDRDYVRYLFLKSDIDRGVSRSYEIGFSPQLPHSPIFISIGGSDNILDRMKIRFQIRILGIPFTLDDTDFWAQLSLYKDGPVRVIRRIRNAIQFTKRFRTPSAAIENIIYDNASVVPFRFKFIISPRLFKSILNVKGHVGADFQNLHGYRVKTNIDPRWLKIDGEMDEQEKNLQEEGFNWFLITGPQGAFMIRAILNRNPDGSVIETSLRAGLYYRDDDNLLDPPESVPGQSPQVGFKLYGVEDLGRGTVYVYAVMYLIKGYQEGGEKEYLNILDHPVEARVN